MSAALPSTILSEAEVRIAPTSFPVEVDLVHGALRATVHLHAIATRGGTLPCWSYVTAGLTAHGQKEVVFTVAVDPGGDPGRVPTEPLRFATTLFQLASQGKTVDAGGVSELGGAGFMDRRGLTYVSAQPIDGVPLGPSTLAVVALSDEELQVLRVCGQTRVLSALGSAYGHYPFPQWIDRLRKSVITPESTRGTILSKVPLLPIHGSARMDGGDILLRVQPKAAKELAQALTHLPADAGFALTTEVAPDSDGCLIWQAGQRGPAAITPPGSRGTRLSGAFLLVIPKQPNDGGQLFEDGFNVLLSEPSTVALRNALSSGEPLSLQGSAGKMGLSLAWIRTTYQNPIDGSVVHAEGGFHVYRPTEGAGAVSNASIRLKHVTLLTSEADVAARIAVEALSAYSVSIKDLATELLEPHARGASWELVVDVSLEPGRSPHYRMASRGEGADATACRALEAKLPSLVPPPVQSGPVAFQLLFNLGASTV